MSRIPARRRLAPVLLGLMLGCGPQAAREPEAPAGAPSPAAVRAARDAADRAATGLTAMLFTELARALAEAPPERAVEVCGEVAQRLTADEAARHGITLRRTTLRIRNPANSPDDFERRVLEDWAAPGARVAPVDAVVPAEGGGYELRYLRPIVLQPICTSCHGMPGAIPERLAAAIRARYPGDRALGYQPGDIRGAVAVRVPLPAR